MKSRHTIVQTLPQNLTLKNVSLIYFSLFLIVVVSAGCTNSEDFANPFDADNLKTAGAPELKLYAGDREVRVTWIDTETRGNKGI